MVPTLSRPLDPHQLGIFCHSRGQFVSLCEVWEIASQTSGSRSSLPARRTVAGVGWVHRLSTCPSQGQSPSPIPNRWTLHAGPSCSPFQAPTPLHMLILMASWSMQALRMRCKYISTPWCYGPKVPNTGCRGECSNSSQEWEVRQKRGGVGVRVLNWTCV